MVHEFLTSNLAGLRESIEKVNKRAAKLGCPLVVLEDLGASTLVQTANYHAGQEVVDRREYTLNVNKVRVTVEPVILDGWEVFAMVDFDYTPDNKVVATARWSHRDVSELLPGLTNICDHCGLKRSRRSTFLVSSDTTVMSVGTGCIADFSKGHSPEFFEALESVFINLEEFDDCGYSGSGWEKRSKLAMPTLEVLAYTAASIRVTGGWVRKRTSDGGEVLTPSTGTRLRDNLVRFGKWFDDKLEPILPEDRERASQVLTWSRTCLDLPDEPQFNYDGEQTHTKKPFAREVAERCQNDYVNVDDVPFVAAAFPAWEREIRDKDAAALAALTPPHIYGRIEYSGEIVSMKWTEGEFSALKMIVKDQVGRKVWCTVPSKAPEDLVVGDKIKFTVTVEAPRERPGRKPDPTFAFGLRPTKLVVTGKAATS